MVAVQQIPAAQLPLYRRQWKNVTRTLKKPEELAIYTAHDLS